MSRRRILACLAVTSYAALLALPGAHAALSGSTSNTSNSYAAAATFPNYPTSVVADSPLFYYRMDDAPGALTATDSSGNGNTGVYGSSKYGQGWTGLWPMDEGSGTTAADRSGAASTHDLTLQNATWTASGHSGSALNLNGTTGYAATASIPVATNVSFSVTAWVYLADTSTSRTAVSESGSNVSAFELGYDSTSGRWAFGMPRSNNWGATVDRVTSSAAPTLNTWTQLAATYTSSSNAMDLYVNGVKQISVTFAGTPWNATGALEVGAGLNFSRTHFWSGRVDEVRVYTTVLTNTAAYELALGATGAAATSWQFDENTGTTTADYSGAVNTGTLGSSVSWGTAKSGASAVDLPGNGNGYVSGTSSAVDTTTSFTVAAWVYLDHTTLTAMSRTALSLSGNIKSAFSLRFNYYGQSWEFGLTEGAADDYSPTYDSSYSSAVAPALTTWTHLAGVYDASAQTVTLYVNGVAQTPASHTSVFRGTGTLQVGRVKEFGSFITDTSGLNGWGPWAGRIDDVRAYRRALNTREIAAVYNNGAAYSTVGLPGALQGAQQGQTVSTAMAFANSDSRASYNPTRYTNPTTYSLECWFRTGGLPGSPTNGQTLLSFGSLSNGDSGTFDRKLYLDATGHLGAGTSSGVSGMALSSGTYWDSAWHHAVATVSPTNGIKLYVDGSLVASAAYAAPANYTGYWRWGGENFSATWPSDYYHLGELDEVAVYDTELSAARVAAHYHANH